MPADWPAGVRADGLGGDASLFGPSSTSTVATENYTPDRRITKAEGLAVLPRRSVPNPSAIFTVSASHPSHRRQADSFLLCYWEFIHPLFPVLHRPSFLRKYERLWTGEENLDTCKGVEDATFNATLNLVFAIGCNFTTWIGPSLKAFVAEDFFQRARSSYHFDILDSNSISTVQMLVLTAIYLQSTQYASRCWNTLGLAVRMAQGLGLHVDAHGRRLMSNVEEQMRRRIWHTCVHLDRLTATTFGRPSMIRPVVDVPLPDILDDEQLADGNLGAQPEKPSRLGLFVYSSRLFELMGEILDRFYRHGAPKRDAADIVTSALEFNRRLDDFAANLPEHLRVLGQNEPASPPTEDYVQLQRQVLNCRFLYVRLQSLRPLLEIATERDPKPFSDPSLDDDVVQDCCNRCISTACQLVGAIHDNIGTLYRSSGWHSVYLTFAAAVTLLASYKATKQLRLPNDDRETAWVRSLAILEHYESQIPSAAHAMGILKSIKAQILPASSGVAPGMSPDQWHSSGHVLPTDFPFSPLAAPSTNESSQLDPALRAASDLLPDHDGAAETAVMEAAAPVDLHARISVEDSQVFNAMNISEAWYGQQLLDLDWLEIPPPTWQ
jgi:hypothetical protein